MVNHINGEWQIEQNQWGGERRFRWVGGIKEYEPTIRIDGIEIPQSELAEYNQLRAENAKQMMAADQHAQQTHKTCPFKGARGSFDTWCKHDCAFFHDGGCILATATTRPTEDTRGTSCPIVGKCDPSCAMFADGCMIKELVKGVARKGNK